MSTATEKKPKQNETETTETRTGEEQTEPERRYELPDGADDDRDGPDTRSGDTALFDRSQYDKPGLQISKVDGQTIDRLALKFSGTVFLDRSDEADCELYRRLSLKGDVTLMVEGRCSATGAKGATDRDGNLDVVIGEKTVKVHTVYVSTADGLEAKGVAAAPEPEPEP